MTIEEDALLQHFGYSKFKTGQDRIVRATLDGRDVLAVMSTGHGKSVCFQLPALISGKTSIVVIPLLSLADDQLADLAARHIAARKFNSTVTNAEKQVLLNEMDSATPPVIVYVTPESFQIPAFIAMLDAAVAKQQIGAFVVDEVHTMVEWGADFRPDFLKLSMMRKKWPSVPIAAFTATADRALRMAICSTLALADTRETVMLPFDRPNITPVFLAHADPLADIKRRMEKYTADHDGALPTCIAYCHKQDTCEKYAAAFAAMYPAANPAFYHADADAKAKAERDTRVGVVRRWKTPCTRTEMDASGAVVTRDDTCYVVFATKALGMGINKANVRFVFQVDPPHSVNEVMQMAGRAGRDGLQAFYFFYVNPAQIALYERFNKMDLAARKISPQRFDDVKRQLDAMRSVMRMGSPSGMSRSGPPARSQSGLPKQCRRAIIIGKIDGNEALRVKCSDAFAKCDMCTTTPYEFVSTAEKPAKKRKGSVQKAIRKGKK